MLISTFSFDTNDLKEKYAGKRQAPFGCLFFMNVNNKIELFIIKIRNILKTESFSRGSVFNLF